MLLPIAKTPGEWSCIYRMSGMVVEIKYSPFRKKKKYCATCLKFIVMWYKLQWSNMYIAGTSTNSETNLWKECSSLASIYHYQQLFKSEKWIKEKRSESTTEPEEGKAASACWKFLDLHLLESCIVKCKLWYNKLKKNKPPMFLLHLLHCIC
jgi:hypothetical protein